jgi:hypothetical protein
MHFKVYKYKFSCPFYAILAKLANTCYTNVLEVLNDH